MELIRVGNFELRPSERMLCCEGRPVELGARAFDLLLVLVEYRGRLVTKATLLDRVWPRLVVDENNLPAQVASLRRILGAGAIRTVPGFGYRLELAVSSEPARAPTAAPRTPEPPRLIVPRRTWPNRLGSLVGRDAEVRDLLAALERASLVTIVGVAGVGKTRLAREILVRKADTGEAAVAWVALHPIKEAEHVPSAIAIALGLALRHRGADCRLCRCRACRAWPGAPPSGRSTHARDRQYDPGSMSGAGLATPCARPPGAAR